MKTKILILMDEHCQHESMLARELKALSENYEVSLADSIIDALDKITKAKIEKNPIRGLVFERKTLTLSPGACRLVCQLAANHSAQHVTAINMIHNDQDEYARKCAVSVNYCRPDNWRHVKVMFDNNFKM